MSNLYTDSLLGKKVSYSSQYDPTLLHAIPRQSQRQDISIFDELPFKGADLWNAYELSWLNAKGKPVVAMGHMIVPCHSANIFESKSLKLYFNSFNQTRFESIDQVKKLIEHDLSKTVGAPVNVQLYTHQQFEKLATQAVPGICIDDLDIEINEYQTNPALLRIENTKTTETLHSHLLRSNCLVTSQPDWASVIIKYQGNQINHESLLRYLVSYRNHTEFGEHCVERMFQDITQHCQPEKLTVLACYTRRGGLDINPFRSSFEDAPLYFRTLRQ